MLECERFHSDCNHGNKLIGCNKVDHFQKSSSFIYKGKHEESFPFFFLRFLNPNSYPNISEVFMDKIVPFSYVKIKRRKKIKE